MNDTATGIFATKILMLSVATLLIAWDVFAVLKWGDEASISVVLYRLSDKYIWFPFIVMLIAGGIIGHIFAPLSHLLQGLVLGGLFLPVRSILLWLLGRR